MAAATDARAAEFPLRVCTCRLRRSSENRGTHRRSGFAGCHHGPMPQERPEPGSNASTIPAGGGRLSPPVIGGGSSQSAAQGLGVAGAARPRAEAADDAGSSRELLAQYVAVATEPDERGWVVVEVETTYAGGPAQHRFQSEPCATCPWLMSSELGRFPPEVFRHSATDRLGSREHPVCLP